MAGRIGVFLAKKVWPKLELPLVELIVHFAVTVVAVLAIAAIEALMHWTGFDRKIIPLLGMTLGDWMFVLEIVAASAIILIGIGRAIWTLIRE